MQVTGFPIHLPYSDIQHIVSTVERTSIHLCEDQKVEYALAVYVHPYPNDVLSVWLYVASLVPKWTHSGQYNYHDHSSHPFSWPYLSAISLMIIIVNWGSFFYHPLLGTFKGL